MASSNRPWTALPLFARIQFEKGAPTTADRINNRDDYLKKIHMPLSQPPTGANTAIQVPDFLYAAATKEPHDTFLSRQLPLPSTNPSINSFEIHNTSLTSNMPSASVSSVTHQHTTQEHRAEHLEPSTGDVAHGLSRDMSATASWSQQTVANPLEEYGIPLHNSSLSVSKAWCCGFPGCNSQVIFTRACDLHKHYKRHSQRFYCRKKSCSRSAESDAEAKLPPSGSSGPSNSALNDQVSNGTSRVRHRWFASKKDRDRHEAKHSPRIQCTWRGSGGEHCPRVFSRLDNMKDHIRRVHKPTMGHHDED